VIKAVGLFKRKPGMSKDDFIAYYEEHHARIGEKIVGGAATHYLRRYLYAFGPGEPEPEYDVIMELWFPDRATLDARMAWITGDPAAVAERETDEENLFDRSTMLMYVVEEHESDLAALQAAATS
jgi:hypothetical protein